MFCKNCGSNVNDGELFCPSCGAKQDVAENAAPQQPGFQQEPQEAPVVNAPEAKKGFNPDMLKGLTKHKLFKPLAAVIAVVLVICIVIVPIFGTVGSAKKADFYLFQTEDGEVYIKYSKDKEAKEVTDEYCDDFTYVADKKLLFFVETDGSTLCYVNVSKKELKPVKVDKDVDSYSVSEDGKTVWFMSDGDLYVSDLKNSEKVEKDVYDFYVNEKGDKCTFFVRDNDEEENIKAFDVFSTGKNVKIKTVAEDVSDAIGSSRKEGYVFYQDREVIYSLEIGASKAKKALTIENWSSDSGVSVYGITGAKDFYYTINEEYDLIDFVSDSYNAEEDKDAEYDTDGYYRNNIRSQIDDEEYPETIISRSLHYVKGGKDKGVIATGVNYPSFYSEYEYLRFSSQTINVDAKVNIDNLVDAYKNYDYDDEDSKHWRDILTEAVYGDYAENLAIEGKVNVIASAESMDDLSVAVFSFDEKGKKLYYFKDYDEKDQSGDLYCAKVSGKTLKEGKVLYNDVWKYGITEKGQVITIRDYEDGEGTLFIDKKQVSGGDDVSSFYIAQDGTIFFRSDVKNGKYTLNQVNGSKSVKIADDVSSFAALGKNDIMFIDDDAELYQYNKKSSKSIEEDVMSLGIIYSI